MQLTVLASASQYATVPAASAAPHETHVSARRSFSDRDLATPADAIGAERHQLDGDYS